MLLFFLLTPFEVSPLSYSEKWIYRVTKLGIEKLGGLITKHSMGIAITKDLGHIICLPLSLFSPMLCR